MQTIGVVLLNLIDEFFKCVLVSTLPAKFIIHPPDSVAYLDAD